MSGGYRLARRRPALPLAFVPVPDVVPPPTQRLAPLTTLRLGGPAHRFVEATSADAVVDAVRAADAAGEPLLLLGGGSNVVIADEGWPGTVVRVAHTGHALEDRKSTRLHSSHV